MDTNEQSEHDIAVLAGESITAPVVSIFKGWFPQISGSFKSIQGGNVRITMEFNGLEGNNLQELYRIYQIAESQAGGPLAITIAVLDNTNV